ncbi:hypothetical protein ESY86_08265 [Subsaximicrobium wynnwilliamsii]|uniref:Uncharacterized protein n=1 Tax=Subsaximicrobium wynnwilliamsii TaxID=291179 RepID=A0A5C6ZHU1_9FLAO|nr:hypothetical protein ESY87_08940 [Subsaximicrobium wynnwilliamsii]TXD89503.1 hypothetical protein ESY86_08265 [Subsaximicrobium wynnwilliamsii]TXE03621.1 hypothetical protein ESY88_07965 [Subsaximicrobium wynnwilliamsii]
MLLIIIKKIKDLKNLFCKLFQHEIVVKTDVTKIVKEYECIHCKKQFTTSDKGKLIPLTTKRKETNKVLKSLYQRRKKIKKLIPNGRLKRSSL